MTGSTSLIRQSGLPESQAKRRNEISSVLVVILIGLAYAEAVPPVRNSIRAQGITLGTSILFGVFFLTSLRFFVGAYLHLISPDLARLPGMIWFYDLSIIIIEMVIFIFLGGVASLDASLAARFGFVPLLVLLYLVDSLWVASQWVLARAFKAWRRPSIPWAWCILNAILVLLMLVPGLVSGVYYSAPLLISLGLANLAAFLVDIVLVDHYDLL